MPLSTAAIDSFADALVRARTAGPIPTPTTAIETDAEAYAIQDAVLERLNRKPKAWKVGAAAPGALPNGAPILDVFDAMAGAPIPARGSVGVELEFAFQLQRAVPTASTAPGQADVEAALGPAHIVLETCVSRLAEGMDAPPRARLADFGINHGLIIGPVVADWRRVDLSTLRALVTADGKVIADLTAAHTHPNLMALATWLVGHAVTTRGGLAEGTWITTGSWSHIRFVAAPARIIGTFQDVGSIDVRLV